jgi:hypothetical protein
MKKIVILGLLALLSLVATPVTTLTASQAPSSQLFADGGNGNATKPGGG